MRLETILSADRVRVDPSGDLVTDKRSALELLGTLLASPLRLAAERVTLRLMEREQLQSTGIGDGVAIPHAPLDDIRERVAALLVCPLGVPFDAIDGAPVSIVLGVVGPRGETGEHLRVLARVSRWLREPATREALRAAPDAEAAWALVQRYDAGSEGGIFR